MFVSKQFAAAVLKSTIVPVEIDCVHGFIARTLVGTVSFTSVNTIELVPRIAGAVVHCQVVDGYVEP